MKTILSLILVALLSSSVFAHDGRWTQWDNYDAFWSPRAFGYNQDFNFRAYDDLCCRDGYGGYGYIGNNGGFGGYGRSNYYRGIPMNVGW